MSIMKYLEEKLRPEYRSYIKNLYSYYTKCDKPKEIAKVILVYLFEFVTGCFYLVDSNGTEKRSVNLLENKIRDLYGKDMVALIDILYDIRNGLAHEPFLSFEEIRVNSVKDIQKYNTPETVKKFCSVFEEESAKFEQIYTDVMETLGLLPDSKQKQEQEDTTSSLQNDSPLSLDTHYF